MIENKRYFYTGDRMTTLYEGNLCFHFPKDWQVIKYDGGNHFYRNQISKCQGTKAVDILAWSGKDLWLLEVKDFRGYRVENKNRLNNGELAIEVAQKVRDTIAGLYGAYRCGNETLRPFCQPLCSGQLAPVKVILFLEEDRHLSKVKGVEQSRLLLSTAIKNQLRFLQLRCSIYNRSNLPTHLCWRVTSYSKLGV
jgi:hypothetical protein